MGSKKKKSELMEVNILKTKFKLIALFMLILNVYFLTASCSSQNFIFNKNYVLPNKTPKIIFNGKDVTNELQPVIKNNIIYVADCPMLKLLIAGADIKIYPIFSKVDNRLVQVCNYFTNTDWSESMNEEAVIIYPNSTKIKIRLPEMVERQLDKNSLTYKEQTGNIIVNIDRSELENKHYDWRYLDKKLQPGKFRFNAMSLRTFVKNASLSSSVYYDKTKNIVYVNVNGFI